MPVVWISGGARRIGKAIALRFAQRGYDVGFTYRTSEREAIAVCDEVRQLGRAVHASRCDVRVEADIQQAMNDCSSMLGIPDVVVSNVGVFPERTPVSMIDEQDVLEAFAVNTIPLLTIGRVYHEQCSSRGAHGRIISIGSLGAHEIWRDRIAYNVSKSALHTMVATLARGLAPTISVNSVAPGVIAQPEDVAEHELRAMVGVDRIPMQRHGNVDDVFDAVWFFATASSYITGQNIIIDGGYHLTR